VDGDRCADDRFAQCLVFELHPGLYTPHGFLSSWVHEVSCFATARPASESRSRYFEHYRGRAQETAGTGCDYTVSAQTPPVP
jgi:hypothetical protein